jgi:hypothetical protein
LDAEEACHSQQKIILNNKCHTDAMEIKHREKRDEQVLIRELKKNLSRLQQCD